MAGAAFGAAGTGVLVAFCGAGAALPASVPTEGRTPSCLAFATRFSSSNSSNTPRSAVRGGSAGVEVENVGAIVGSAWSTPPRHHTKTPTAAASIAPKRIQRIMMENYGTVTVSGDDALAVQYPDDPTPRTVARYVPAGTQSGATNTTCVVVHVIIQLPLTAASVASG